MLCIISRNVDSVRVQHTFCSAEAFIEDWESDDPKMGDNEILFVEWNMHLIYSSLYKPCLSTYADTLRTADLYEWFK